MDFQALRKEYEDRGLAPKALANCPLRQLEQWLEEATEKRPGTWFEPNSMALATCGSNGYVSVRYVLLKEITSETVRFFTNYDSSKGKQLGENPFCSMSLHWPYLGRQVRISGSVEKTTREISEAYFHSRPRGAQLGAAISRQSEIVDNRNELEQRLQALDEQLGQSPVPLPENWGGYQVRPTEVEFWQGRTNRLHDRIVYRGGVDQWEKYLLSP